MSFLYKKHNNANRETCYQHYPQPYAHEKGMKPMFIPCY